MTTSRDSAILVAWKQRDKNVLEHDNIVRISNSFNVSTAYVYQLINEDYWG